MAKSRVKALLKLNLIKEKLKKYDKGA